MNVIHIAHLISLPFIRLRNKSRAITQRDKYSVYIKTIDCAHSRRSTLRSNQVPATRVATRVAGT
jgi:hypothetical protein